jgi:WD40 repeat protein
VLAVLAGDRLVTVGDGDVEVAHEALLREWPRLRGWLEEDAQGRRLHRHLTHASRDWLTAGREPAELYRGARLASALDWIETHEQELNELEREFLVESRSQADVASERQRKANRRLRALLAGLAVLLALALVAGAVAVSQRGQARDAALTADAQRLGAMALTRERLEDALVLARAGVALEDSAVTRSNLLSALMRQPQTLGMLPEDGQPLYGAAVSPDERLAAVGGESGTVIIVELPSRRPLGRPYEFRGGIVQDLRFSPDGRTLAVSGNAPPNARGVVDLIDPLTHERRVRIVPPRYPGPTPFLMANTRFLPNGRDVVVQQIPDLSDVDGAPSVMRRFDGETGAAMGPALRVGRHSSIGMSGTGDRSRLFVTSHADEATYMIDAERLELLQRWPVGDIAGTVSSDGSTFALGSMEGAVRLLDLRSGRVRRLEGGHDGSVVRMGFTRDRRTLVTSGADGMLIVWDVTAGQVRETLSGHANFPIWGLDVSADGRTAYSAGDERSFVWDLAGDRRLVRPFATDRPFVPDDGDTLPRGLALSPDGRTLALGNSDGTVDLIDADTLRPQASLPALHGFVAALAFSRDGRVLAAAGQHGEVTLWDARTLRRRGALTGLRTTTQTLAFSPDGRLLAAAELGDPPETDTADYTGGGVRVWDVRRRALTGVRFQLSSPSIAFSPDGALLAAASSAPTTTPTQIRDTYSGRLVAQLSTSDLGRSVAFSRVGDLLATGHYEGTGQLWSTETWKPVGRPLEGHDGEPLLWIEFSPDASTLATAGLDGTVGLWDVTTQTPIGTPLTIEPETYAAADLSPDGSLLFAVSTGRRAVRWDVSPEAWKRHACRVAGRELTQREWRDALPARPYRTVCARG